MCGISGIAYSPHRSLVVDKATLIRMRDVMVHRGPDEEGYFLDGPVGLAHRRLSIVDLSAGQQPMPNEDGTLQIVFNGEIYNHADHRNYLQSRGHVFSSHSDTETILHLYEEYGAKCVEHLRGMFAFAIWDRRSKELFIARDRLGIKPLYYVVTDDGSLYFASEIKALLAANAIRPELNVQALPDYLANRTTCDDSTLYKGVRRLAAGHCLYWKDGKTRIERYWDVQPSLHQECTKKSDEDYIQEWSELFDTSVRLRLMSDVPLGMFLSGGIDSSAIAAIMSRHVKEPIKTFSVAFNVVGANELEYARLVSGAFKTDHHEVLIGPSDFAAALPHLIWHEDEPIAHSASIPLYFVSKLAQQYVKVVLTGEGSDELLAGYSRYRTTLLNQSLGHLYQKSTTEGLRRIIQNVLSNSTSLRFQGKLQRTFLWRKPDIESIYFDNYSVFSSASQYSIYTDAMRETLANNNPYSALRKYYDNEPGASRLQRMLYTDIKTYLHELLMKQDQMSMAASIESRVPFLDHKLVEYSCALPNRLKLRGWTTKYILRQAMKGILPDKILTRRKMGFPVPLDRWFRYELKPLLDKYVLNTQRGYFREEYLRKLVTEHQSGKANHSDKLWALLNFEIWHRHNIDGEPIQGKLPEITETYK